MSRGTANLHYAQNPTISDPDGILDAQACSAIQSSTTTFANFSAADESFPGANEIGAIGLGIYEESITFPEKSVKPLSPPSPHVHWHESSLTERQYARPPTTTSNFCQVDSPAKNNTPSVYPRNGSNTAIWPSPTMPKLKLTSATIPQPSSKRPPRQQKGSGASKVQKDTFCGLFSRTLESHKRTADRPDAGDTILQLIHNVRGVKTQVDAKGRKQIVVPKQQTRPRQKLGTRHVSLPKRSFPTSSTKPPVPLAPIAKSTRSTKPSSVKTSKPVVSKSSDERISTKRVNQYKSSINQEVLPPKRGRRSVTAPDSKSFAPRPSPYMRRSESQSPSVYPRDDASPVDRHLVRPSTQTTSLDYMEVPFGASSSVEYDAKQTYIDTSKPLPSPPQLLRVPNKNNKPKKQAGVSILDRPFTPYPIEEPESRCVSEAKPSKLSYSITRSKQPKRNNTTRGRPSAPLPPSKGHDPGEVSAHIPATKPNKVRFATVEGAQATKPDPDSPKEKIECFTGLVQTLSKFHKPHIIHCKAGANKPCVKFKGHKISAPGPLITAHVGTANIAASSGGVGGPGSAFSTKLDRRGRPIHPHMRSHRSDNHKEAAAARRSSTSEHIPQFSPAKSYAPKYHRGARNREQCTREREERHVERRVPNSSNEPLSTKFSSKSLLSWVPPQPKEHKWGRRRTGSDTSFGCVGLQKMPEPGISNRVEFVDTGSTPPDTSPRPHSDVTGYTVREQRDTTRATDSTHDILRTAERNCALSPIKKRAHERRRQPCHDPYPSQHSATHENDPPSNPLVSNSTCVTQQPSNNEGKSKSNVESDSQYRDTRFYQLYEDVLREYED